MTSPFLTNATSSHQIIRAQSIRLHWSTVFERLTTHHQQKSFVRLSLICAKKASAIDNLLPDQEPFIRRYFSQTRTFINSMLVATTKHKLDQIANNYRYNLLPQYYHSLNKAKVLGAFIGYALGMLVCSVAAIVITASLTHNPLVVMGMGVLALTLSSPALGLFTSALFSQIVDRYYYHHTPYGEIAYAQESFIETMDQARVEALNLT